MKKKNNGGIIISPEIDKWSVAKFAVLSISEMDMSRKLHKALKPLGLSIGAELMTNGREDFMQVKGLTKNCFNEIAEYLKIEGVTLRTHPGVIINSLNEYREEVSGLMNDVSKAKVQDFVKKHTGVDWDLNSDLYEKYKPSSTVTQPCAISNVSPQKVDLNR